MMYRSTIPTEKDRNFDRQIDRQGGVVSRSEGDNRTRLKVHTAAITAGSSGAAHVMAPRSASPFFSATTLSMPLFVPSGAGDLAVDDEVWGIWHPMGQTYVLAESPVILLKQFCDFTLTAALTQSAASVAGTITSQYGPGEDHASTSITLLNRALHSGASPAYTYHGANGDTGCAVYTGSGTTWTIWDLECPHS